MRQFNITDNLGSVRTSIIYKNNNIDAVKTFDYKPFGDVMDNATEQRIGFIGRERDEESRYFAMAFRQYDSETTPPQPSPKGRELEWYIFS